MVREHTQNNTDTFMELYEQYNNDIFRYCLVKCSSREDALDITQDTFMKFWEYLGNEEEVRNARPLLYRIASNLIIDHYRKKKPTSHEDFRDPTMEHHVMFDEHDRTLDLMDGKQAMTLINDLPESTRDIIFLRFSEGLSISEIATFVKKDNKTVSVYLHRGVQQLKKRIAKYYDK